MTSIVQLARASVDQDPEFNEDCHCIHVLFESWAAKQEALLERFEAHDHRLESIVTRWDYQCSLITNEECKQAVQGSQDPHCIGKGLQNKYQHEFEVVSTGAKLFREDSIHAAPAFHEIDEDISSDEDLGVDGPAGDYFGSGCVDGKLERGMASVHSHGRVSMHVRYNSNKVDQAANIVMKQSNCQAEPERQISPWSKMRSEERRQQLLSLSMDIGNGKKPRGLAALILSRPFQAFCAIVIVSHMSLICVETEYEASTLSTHRSFSKIHLCVNIWYAVEVAIKILASGALLFFTGTDCKWNVLDTVVAITSVIDMFYSAFAAGHLKMTKAVRVIRLARLVRLVRIFRFFTFALEFQKMVFAMANCMSTLFWAMVVLAFVTFCFGIMLTQLVTAAWLRTEGSPSSDSIAELRSMFRSTPFAMYCLFQSITSGISWGIISNLLLDIDSMAAILFLLYVCFTFFGVLNVVTSVFVESALQATQHHRELLVKDKLRTKTTYASHAKSVFHCIDTDRSGMISLEEMEFIFNNDKLRDFIDALEMNATDARMMFKLLDYDGSGQISCDEFVEGCLKLKGEAKSFDVYCLIYENERNLKVTNKFMKGAQTVLDCLAEKVLEISRIMNKMNRASVAIETSMRQFGAVGAVGQTDKCNMGGLLTPIPMSPRSSQSDDAKFTSVEEDWHSI